MDTILNADFDIDNPCESMRISTPVDLRGDYYAKVTKLRGGCLEVCMKNVRPMAQAKFAEQWENHFPVSLAPKDEKSASEIEAEREANHRRAVRKAKQTTRWLVQQMQADRLLTLTYRDNVEDREKVKGDFSRFRRLVANGWKGQPGLKDWRYVAVLEKQQRGAFHVHIAVRGWQPVKFLRQCWYRACGADMDATGSETPGQINVTPPRNDQGPRRKKEWATSRLAFYIVKYMQKTFDETSLEKNRYWRSKDIDAPSQYRHWLVATNMLDAIHELISTLSFSEGFALRMHWSTNDGAVYWCSGVCDET